MISGWRAVSGGAQCLRCWFKACRGHLYEHIRPVTLPFSTHAWKGKRYESTRSRIEMLASNDWRVQCSPATVDDSIELAT